MAMITSAYNLLKLEVVILRRWPELLSYLLWYPAKVLYVVGALQGGWVACGLFLINFCGK